MISRRTGNFAPSAAGTCSVPRETRIVCSGKLQRAALTCAGNPRQGNAESGYVLKKMKTTVVAKNSPVDDPVDALIKSIRIPPRPSLLTDLQQELSASEPDPRKIAKIIASDVGMSGALLKLANSSFFGL